MALDRLTIITSSGLSTVSDYVIDGLRAVGVVTASTVQVGAATTVHTTGVDLGSGNITSHNINSTGIITATGVNVTGDLTVEGTLAYDDVTNIDSVGLGTFRNGINVTGGEVGIGTDNPYHELHIQGDGDTRALITSGASGDAVMMFENASGNTWGHGIDLTNNNYVVAYNSLSDPSLTVDGILDITTDGKVGVRCIPETDFQVRNGNGGTIKIGGSGTSATGLEFQYDNSGTTTSVIKTNYRSTSADASLKIDTGTFLVATGTSGAERLRIKSDGDVYIGNIAHSNDGGANSSYRTLTLTDTTNGAQLHLRGQSPKLFLDVTSGGNGEIYYDTGDLRILSGEPGTTSSEKLRITSDGKIGIGEDNPQHLLHLKSTGDATLLIQADSDNNGENDNPRILLSQDGSTNGMLELGLIGDDNTPLNNTLANSSYIRANNHVDQPLCLGHMGENVMTIRDGKVGITTHDPQGELHLYSNAPVLAATATNASSGLRVNVRGQSVDSSQLFRVQSNNSTRFTVTEGGFLSITNVSSRIPAAPLDVYRETNHTGSAGYVFGTFTNFMGSSGDIDRQRSYLDFVFTDANANFTPQVRIGAQAGWSKGTDQGQESEGNGSFVVYTARGAGASGSLTERFRVDEDGVVTMSGQVAFEARRTTNISGGTNGLNLQEKYVTYESESYDIGGNMNLSTGLFTAPVNGIYLFSFGMSIAGGDGGDDSVGVNFRIANNSTYYNFTNSSTGDFRINPRFSTRSGNEHTYTFTKQVRMAEGATCGFYITDWNYANTVLEYAEFCGCKVA